MTNTPDLKAHPAYLLALHHATAIADVRAREPNYGPSEGSDGKPWTKERADGFAKAGDLIGIELRKKAQEAQERCEAAGHTFTPSGVLSAAPPAVAPKPTAEQIEEAAKLYYAHAGEGPWALLDDGMKGRMRNAAYAVLRKFATPTASAPSDLTETAKRSAHAYWLARELPQAMRMTPDELWLWLGEAREWLTVARAVSQPQAPSVPEGWPTPAMVTAGAEEVANYYDDGNDQRHREVARFTFRAMLSAAPSHAAQEAGWQPIETAPKIDGHEVLALVQYPFEKEPRRRVIAWNNGIGKAAYNRPCWMCSIMTVSVPDEYILGFQPLPAPPSASSAGES